MIPAVSCFELLKMGHKHTSFTINFNVRVNTKYISLKFCIQVDTSCTFDVIYNISYNFPYLDRLVLPITSHS